MIPRIRLAQLPTPVEPLPRISAKLGGPNLWVKRDDQTGVGLGGNKARKLEFVLAEAQANGARTLITVGGIQSNHCRQTAALAAKMGIDCVLVLSGSPGENPNGNVLLDRLFGSKIVWCRREERDSVLHQTFDQLWEDGKRPYLIPLGASNPVGTVGYYTAFLELLEQKSNFDVIWVASSSGGTHAGLALAAKEKAWTGKVIGLSIDHSVEELSATVATLANEAADRLALPTRLDPSEIHVNADHLGAGYAIMGDPEIEAIRLFAEYEGLLLDPVYTGRAAAGLIASIRNGKLESDQQVLFWHTGGTPALFADTYSKPLYL